MKTYKYIIHFILLIITNIFISCQKEEFIPAVEPELPPSDNTSNIGDIIVSNIEISKTSISFAWNKQQSVIKYDIIINDSITARDIVSDFISSDKVYYTINGLNQDTDYTITIRAFDKNDNIKSISFKTKTKKDLIANIKQIVLDKYRYNYIVFESCFVTKNKDFIIIVSTEIHNKYTTLILKLTRDYRIEWIKETTLVSIYLQSEFSDGSLLFIHSSGAAKISTNGNIVWNKEIPTSIMINTGLAVDDNTCYLAGCNWGYGPMRQFYIVKLDENGSILWEDYGEKKVYIDMYSPQKIFINDKNNIVVTGGTMNDGGVYGGKESLFFFEYTKEGTLVSKKIYTIDQIPYYIENVKYIDNHIDGGYIIFTYITDWSSGRSDNAILCIRLTDKLDIVSYDKQYYSSGGYFPFINSVYKRTDFLYSWLLFDDRGIILVNVDKDGKATFSLGLYGFPLGIISFSDNDYQTTYITKNGLIITLNNYGLYDGFPKFIADEIILYK